MKDEDLKKYINPSLYRILCLDRNATPNMIKKGYRGVSLVVHPDRNPDDPLANEKTAQVNFAYQVLSHPVYKPRYDKIYDSYKAATAEHAKKRQQEEVKKKQTGQQRASTFTAASKRTAPVTTETDDWREFIKDMRDLMNDFKKNAKK